MTQLERYGWDSSFASVIPDGLIPARVIELQRGSLTVVCPEGVVKAKLVCSTRNKSESADQYPAAGDFVLIRRCDSDFYRIESICPRKTKFSRTDFSGHPVKHVRTVLEQVLAANFDTAFITVSLNQDFSISRIERYLGAVHQSGAVPVILLTKSDLEPGYADIAANVKAVTQCSHVFAVSAKTGFGLEALALFLTQGRTCIFLGSSGSGKSSLVNAIAGEEVMKVNEIRENDSKGRHTTTHRQLVMLKTGAMVIDTPGLREIGMWNAADGIQEAFADIAKLEEKCRFSDCTHRAEKGCALRAAVDSGSLDPERFSRYQSLMRENAWGNSKSPGVKRSNPHVLHRNRSETVRTVHDASWTYDPQSNHVLPGEQESPRCR